MRRVAVLLLVLGVAELLLAIQQYFFWLAPRRIVFIDGNLNGVFTKIHLWRTDDWDVSIITAVLSITAGIMLYRARSSRLCQAAMLILALWGVVCILVLWVGRGDLSRGSVFYPRKRWHMSGFLTGVLLDSTYGATVLLGPVTVLVAIWSFSLMQLPDFTVTTKCPNCKYDLVGNISGICPECGQSIPDEQKMFLDLK